MSTTCGTTWRRRRPTARAPRRLLHARRPPRRWRRFLTAHPEVDFVQLQVNYLDWDDPVTQSARCMEVAAAHGVPVIIMEPVRGGRLANLPSVAPGAWPLPTMRARRAGPTASASICRACSRCSPAPPRSIRCGTTWPPSKPRAADRGGARCHRRRHRGPAQRGSHPMHELRLLREGLPRGCEDPHRHEPVESGEDLRGQRVRQGSLLWQAAEGPARPSASSAAPARLCAPQSIGIIDRLAEAVEHFEG